jgi:hypothetical protein
MRIEADVGVDEQQMGGRRIVVTFPRPAPGFYSSPFLFAASVWLMVRLRRTARVDFQLSTSD